VCFFIFARETAGAARTRHSLRPLFSRVVVVGKARAFSRRENDEVCVVGCERAVVPSIIVREGGRSSIPEKVMMESKAAAYWITRFRG
jgi:hypothetical protein